MSSESRFQVCGGGIQLKPLGGKRSIGGLKPQDSFGEFDKFVLHFQKVQEIIRPSCNCLLCNIAQWQIIIMYITYRKVFGGTPKIFMFWLFPENGSISDWTVNRALIKFCIKKQNLFHHVPKLSIGFEGII